MENQWEKLKNNNNTIKITTSKKKQIIKYKI